MINQVYSKNEREINILLLGAPGSGKTTFGTHLEAAFDQADRSVVYVSLGQLSLELSSDSLERKELDDLYALNQGPVGSSDLFLRILEPTIDELSRRGAGVILDGMPKKFEEIDSLLGFMAAYGYSFTNIHELKLDREIAIKRVSERGVRDDGKDTVAVAKRRHDRYLLENDILIEQLSRKTGALVDRIDVDAIKPGHYPGLARLAARAAINEKNIDFGDKSFLWIGEQEPLSVSSSDVSELIFEDIPESELMRMVAPQDLARTFEAILQQGVDGWVEATYPGLEKFPRAASLYKEALDAQFLMPVEHLHAQLQKEYWIRIGKGGLPASVSAQLITEVRAAYDAVTMFSEEYRNIGSINDVAEEHFMTKKAYFTAVEENLNPDNLTAVRDLYDRSVDMWNIVTRSDVRNFQEFNYQREINSVPGSHHSLVPPLLPEPKNVLSNSIFEYSSFIEAVTSSSRQGFESTFGFIHTVGVDGEGNPFQVEAPIYSFSKEFIESKNPMVQSILARIAEIDFNHDDWHHLLPVFSNSFNLYHPNAPIAYGGLADRYKAFGESMRENKEEYEIAVAMGHSQTMQYRYEKDEEFKDYVDQSSRQLIQDIIMLNSHTLAEECDLSEPLLEIAVSRYLNIFPPNHPVLTGIEALLSDQTYCSTKVDYLEVKTLLQDLGANFGTLEDNGDMLRRDGLLGFSCENTEHDIEFVLSALHDIGIGPILLGDEGSVHLKNIDAIRYLSIIGPQRKTLKGHMERVHKRGSLEISGESVSPFELLKIQEQTLKEDDHMYLKRRAIREKVDSIESTAAGLIMESIESQESSMGDVEAQLLDLIVAAARSSITLDEAVQYIAESDRLSVSAGTSPDKISDLISNTLQVFEMIRLYEQDYDISFESEKAYIEESTMELLQEK